MTFAEFLKLENKEKFRDVLFFSASELMKLDTEQFKLFCDALAQCKSYETLALNVFYFNQERLQILGDTIAQCTSLRILRIPTGIINIKSWDIPQLELLANIIIRCQLQAFYAPLCDLGSLSASRLYAFLKTLAQSQSLQTLDLSNNTLTDLKTKDILEAFCNALAQYKSLRKFYLAGHPSAVHQKTTLYLGDLDSDCLQKFGGAIAQCQSLEILDITSNKIGQLTTERLKILTENLAKLPLLCELNLSANFIHNLDMSTLEILCNALLQYKALHTLNLTYNFLTKLDENCTQLIVNTLAQLQSLHTLWVDWEFLSLLFDKHEFKTLRVLYVRGLPSKDYVRAGESKSYEYCMEGLKKALTKCSGLQVLNLEKNSIGSLPNPSHFILFCDALKASNSLRIVKIEKAQLNKLDKSLFQYLPNTLKDQKELLGIFEDHLGDTIKSVQLASATMIFSEKQNSNSANSSSKQDMVCDLSKDTHNGIYLPTHIRNTILSFAFPLLNKNFLITLDQSTHFRLSLREFSKENLQKNITDIKQLESNTTSFKSRLKLAFCKLYGTHTEKNYQDGFKILRLCHKNNPEWKEYKDIIFTLLSSPSFVKDFNGSKEDLESYDALLELCKKKPSPLSSINII